MCVKELCVPNSPWIQGPITDGTGCTGAGYRKMTIRLKDAAVCGDRVTQTWPHTHFCSAIMCVKELCVPNSPWTQGPITDGTGCTGSWLP